MESIITLAIIVIVVILFCSLQKKQSKIQSWMQEAMDYMVQHKPIISLENVSGEEKVEEGCYNYMFVQRSSGAYIIGHKFEAEYMINSYKEMVNDSRFGYTKISNCEWVSEKFNSYVVISSNANKTKYVCFEVISSASTFDRMRFMNSIGG